MPQPRMHALTRIDMNSRLRVLTAPLAALLALGIAAAGCASADKQDDAAAGQAGAAGSAQPGTVDEEALRRTDRGTGAMGEGKLVEKLVPIYFGFDEAVVKESEKPKVKTVAEYLKQEANGQFSLRLEGHADDRGSADYNLVLGERRADAVKDLLVAYGIGGDRLSTVSYGEEFPVVEGRDAESYALNRRVEFVLVTPGKPTQATEGAASVDGGQNGGQ